MWKGRWNWHLSCGFERFWNKNKLFLLTPSGTTPISRLLVGCCGFANTYPFSSSSSLSEGLPIAALYFLLSDLAFGCLESICFQGCWSLPLPFSFLSPKPKSGLYSYAIFKFILYPPNIFNKVKWHLGLSETIDLLTYSSLIWIRSPFTTSSSFSSQSWLPSQLSQGGVCF